MKNVRGILFLPLVMLPLLGHAQHVVDMILNGIRANDQIEVIETGYQSSGDAGRDVTWDVSQISDCSHVNVSFKSDSTGAIVCNDGKSLSSFVMCGDSLLQTGYETPLEHSMLNSKH